MEALHVKLKLFTKVFYNRLSVPNSNFLVSFSNELVVLDL